MGANEGELGAPPMSPHVKNEDFLFGSEVMAI
eukprot:CAMPEP_0170498556 /NCGR_PEP_ID=MMETSP0208-20121228/28213_1 /TAXON_ID=197538 /ORGANISM="Strombidium inclinatum, Strain S3" /LENGTH=31 /DNA_ID= /DNA_START= /DNA_END= /DNA_ORIENTATION=